MASRSRSGSQRANATDPMVALGQVGRVGQVVGQSVGLAGLERGSGRSARPVATRHRPALISATIDRFYSPHEGTMADTLLATRLKKGMIIKLDGELLRIHDLMHVTPATCADSCASRRATCGARRCRSRSCARKTSSSGRRSTRRRCSSSTATATAITSWTPRSYEQIHMCAETLGDSVGFLKPEMTIQVEFYGDEPVGHRAAADRGSEGGRDRARHQGRDGDQPDEARDARDRRDRAGAAVRRRRRHIRVNTETGEYLARA